MSYWRLGQLPRKKTVEIVANLIEKATCGMTVSGL